MNPTVTEGTPSVGFVWGAREVHQEAGALGR